MKHLILFFSLLLLQQVSAGDSFFQDDEGMLKTKAKELTKKYKAELDLTSSQTVQFEEMVATYMIRKAKAKKLDVSAADKAVMMKQLYVQESEDMEDILSKGQYKKYLKAKMELQPSSKSGK